MPIRRWLPALASTLVLAQDVPFPEERPEPWVPRWELTARAERITDLLGDGRVPMDDVHRAGLQVRLRWGAAWGWLDWEAGFRSAVGSDGNAGNLPRWDQEPSNGTELDVARADLSVLTERAFGRLRLGFQELGLITTQAMWDPDLRFLGVGASAGWRSGFVREAGLRGASGRVRTLYRGNDLDLGALQAVLKLEWGPYGATFHADRWNLTWTVDEGRFQALDFRSAGRARLTLDGVGAAAAWEGFLPLEVRWSAYRETVTRDTSEEFQVVAGNRVRPFVPQVSYTWQRLSSTGELYPLNSDAWWYYRGAKGPRYALDLPLGGEWLVSVSYLRQSVKSTPKVAEKTALAVIRRF